MDETAVLTFVSHHTLTAVITCDGCHQRYDIPLRHTAAGWEETIPRLAELGWSQVDDKDFCPQCTSRRAGPSPREDDSPVSTGGPA